ncbi:hypothetical protein CYCME_1808 [Cycloclasticus zancles 78-ME]|jgi:hypothetical protein|uniref:Peptidase M48 domain-containing protein n=2 Tax=Pseudomonadota TaxID=1224 RepID=S5T8N1_9GAMM|nr:hypothetical protein CYCME_1808 [Cycloclasticus zancles 78-ME]
MILGDWGLALNILTIAILSVCFTVFLMSLFINRLEGLLLRFDASSRSLLLWFIVILPWFVSCACVAVLVFPELFIWKTLPFTSPLHWHHIYTFPLVSWHGATLVLFSFLCLFLMLTKLLKALKITSHLNQLKDFLNPATLPNGCVLIESQEISAFTSGFFRPQAYITRGLCDLLSKEESFIVQQHELAHAKYAHPLKKYIFSLFALFFPQRVENKLNDSYALSLEQLADDTVLKQTLDVTLISKTILRVVRLQGGVRVNQREFIADCAFTAHPSALRIKYLLNDNKGRSFPYLFVFISTLTVLAINSFSVDYIHHSFEHLFSH